MILELGNRICVLIFVTICGKESTIYKLLPCLHAQQELNKCNAYLLDTIIWLYNSVNMEGLEIKFSNKNDYIIIKPKLHKYT